MNDCGGIKQIPPQFRSNLSMQDVKATRVMEPAISKKYIPVLSLLVIIVAIGLYAYGKNVYKAFQSPSVPTQAVASISQSTLEQTYGLRVNLVAVTAAGGLVDVRLKIVNGNKAKTLLGDQKNFPSLLTDNGTILRASKDFTEQEIKFENDNNLFIMFSNPQNLVKPGSPITILFGDTALEPIPSR
jgi:hypothetical protein